MNELLSPATSRPVTMDQHRVPCKTDLGRRALQGRDFPGTRAQRMFLIMADGRTPMSELWAAAAQLRVDEQALHALEAAGLLTWRHRIPARVADAVRPAPASAAPRSLAAAKMYALDLAALMLQGQDQAVREAACAVGTAPELQRWLTDTAQAIAGRAGSERAALFVQRVAALLPPDADIAIPLEETDALV